MSNATLTSSVAQIGETAGEIWRLLNQRGPMTITALLKEIDEPRDLVMQSLGWLAREDKLEIEENGRSKSFSVR